MQKKSNPTDSHESPFHSGEQFIQSRVGVREQSEQIGQKAIRTYMPDQHREFFEQLPFLVVGSVDPEGWPWASIVSGHPGFVDSPDAETLTVAATAMRGDPLAAAIKPGAQLGLLGIEIPTRRRNRVNTTVTDVGATTFSLAVNQSFGNCPQYIQRRSVEFVRDPRDVNDECHATHFDLLDESATTLIKASDTLFVSSYAGSSKPDKAAGVDVSHRGGKPGFVKIDGNTLTIPDFSGNNFFNTLGNFQVNPKAGLVFLDFETGDVLQLTGRVEIIWGEDAEISAFQGAERAWRFTLERGIHVAGALPFRSKLEEFSPSSLGTGDWVQAQAATAALTRSQPWRQYRIARIEDESSVIRSFYLKPTDGNALSGHRAGQFITIRMTPNGSNDAMIRTYTASSAPDDPYYRISVKRENQGIASSLLHSTLKVGDLIEARAPRGEFYIDANETRPAVLLAGGVGITPMIAMAQHVINEGHRSGHTRPLTTIHAAQSTDQMAFSHAFRRLEKDSNGALRYYAYIGKSAEDEQPGIHYTGTGHITADVLRQLLALDDYDFFLCGPPAFMQALYNALQELGVRDARIFAEAFGPASLIRQPDSVSSAQYPSDEADQATIQFTSSGFEQAWTKGDETILQLAESHGLTPEYGCRSGSCGSCATKLTKGAVAYRTQPSAAHADDEVLICCAVPARGTDTLEITL